MNCKETRAVLSARIDGELSSSQSHEVDEHLQSCADCSTEFRALAGLGDALSSSEIYASAPAHLQRRVSQGLREIDNSGSSWSVVPARLAWGLPTLLLGLVIGWSTLSYINNRAGGDALLLSLTSAHIHSLMADHLTDIASSDSHTVKPWFHGRLDFSPPVHDFTQQGYPLLGGRLEYLAGVTTAAFVYRHRQHTINLFVRPGTSPEGKVSMAKYNGYHLLHWDDDGLSWWAVSDLNLSDLELFRGLVKGRVQQEN